MAETHKLLIDGKWVEGSSGKTFRSINPANTEEVLGEFQRGTAEDMKLALDAAERAHQGWAERLPHERGACLTRAAEIIERRAEELGELLTREEGKTLPEGRGEVLRAAQVFRYFGGEGYRLCGQSIPSVRKDVFIYTFKKPLGVVGIITPWNFPIAIPAWKIAPALVSGNCCVFKPASNTPLIATRLVEVLQEAGLPAGVLNLVTGPGGELGDALLSFPSLKAISFTGSTVVGMGLQDKAARRMIKTQLEMGGKNPTIVLEDADLDAAMAMVTDSAFFSTGQRCTATSRAILHERVAEPFIEGLLKRVRTLKVGNGLEEGVEIGPLVDENQYRTVLGYIDVGREEGAELLFGGRSLKEGPLGKGYFVEPTIFDHVEPGMRIAQEEIFGPVLSIIRVKDLEEALKVANSVEYGLSACLVTRDLSRAFKYIGEIESGMIMVNLPTAGVELQAPFGGTKASSSGFREQGQVAVDFFTELRTVYLRHTI